MKHIKLHTPLVILCGFLLNIFSPCLAPQPKAPALPEQAELLMEYRPVAEDTLIFAARDYFVSKGKASRCTVLPYREHVHTITVDKGSEFADHQTSAKMLRIHRFIS